MYERRFSYQGVPRRGKTGYTSYEIFDHTKSREKSIATTDDAHTADMIVIALNTYWEMSIT